MHFLRILVSTGLLVGCGMAMANPPSVATIVVTSDSDNDGTTDVPNGICTLREAINNADNHGQPDVDCASGGTILTTIVFGSQRSGKPVEQVTINPKFGELSVNATVTLEGPVTIANPPKGGKSRLLHVTSGPGSLLLDKVELENGIQRGASGGAILNEGTLTMIGGSVQASRADHGGAMALYGNTHLRGVELLANKADVDGGAIWMASAATVEIIESSLHANQTINGAGSAIFSGIANPTLTIEQTSFFGNRASGPLGDGTFFGGGIITIRNSAFVRNVTEGIRGGSGIFLTNTAEADLVDIELSGNSAASLTNTTASGGGLFVDGATVTMSRSSVIGNTSWAGGGIYAAPGTLMIVANTTIARNKADEEGTGSRSDAGDGAAVYFDGADANLVGTTIRDNEGRSQLAAKGASSIVSIDNSIVWGVGSKYNCFGTGSIVSVQTGSFQSRDIKDGSCPFPVLNAPDSAVFSAAAIIDDPLPPPDLPLEHVIWIPSAGSQLIGAGNKALCADPMAQNGEDEIGFPRTTCDIGAIESP